MLVVQIHIVADSAFTMKHRGRKKADIEKKKSIVNLVFIVVARNAALRVKTTSSLPWYLVV